MKVVFNYEMEYPESDILDLVNCYLDNLGSSTRFNSVSAIPTQIIQEALADDYALADLIADETCKKENYIVTNE